MNAVVESGQPLAGRCVAIPESRELDVFAALLERRGARVLHCPLVDIRDAPDPAPVLDWLRQFNAGGCDDLLLYTGEGLHRLLAALDRHYLRDGGTPFARLLVTGETRIDHLHDIIAAKIPLLYKPVSPQQLRRAMMSAWTAARDGG